MARSVAAPNRIAFPFQDTPDPAAARTIPATMAINASDRQPLNALPIMRQ